MKGEHGKSGEHHANGEAHNCCGDSCPMKKKDAQAASAAADDGKSCCDNCECCKGKAKTETAAV